MKPDIDPTRTWCVSDTHWGHRNIVGFCHRPPDHDQIMMEEWARAVPEDATVLHLGDLSWKNNAFFLNMIAPHLTGEPKYLILGNHDKSRYSFYRRAGFHIVKPFEIEYLNESWWPGEQWTVSFSHYPLREPVKRERHVHIHGHIHNNGYGGPDTPFVPFAAGQINLSAEQTKYRPVNLKCLLDGYINGCYEPKDDAPTAEAVAGLTLYHNEQ